MRFTTMMLAGALALAGCTEKVHVDVNCETKATSIDCKVKQDQGKAEVEACWDFSVTCGNGAVVTADHTCQKVHDGGEATVSIAQEHIHGLEGCGKVEGKPPVAKLTNLTLNGKASEQ